MSKFFFIALIMLFSAQVHADSLSYSGRLVNSDGSPVAGPVDLKFELAYSGSTGTILCTSNVNAVTLTNGVFHAKLVFTCPSSSFYGVFSNVPAGEDAVLRVTNETADPDKVYSFQTINAVPVAQMAHQLPKMEATNNQVLTWTGAKWEPKNVTGATGGTVTSVATGSGLTGGPFTTTGTIAIATGGVTDSHLASGITRAKIAGGTPNYVVINDGAGAIAEVAQLPLSLGGTGANTPVLARTNLGLGNAAEASIGYSSGNVMPGDGVPVCLSFQKLQFTGTGPTYWSCALDNDSADASKLPLAGGTMSGVINMNNNFIVGVRSPSNPDDAVNKAYVDAQVSGSSLWTSNASNLAYGLGNVVVGSSSPVTKLVVDGGVKISTDFSACTGALYGTLRYNSNTIEYCDSSVWKKLDNTYDLATCPTHLGSYEIGTKILCSCTSAATSGGTIWGTGIYTEDSNPCRAAVHAGALTAASGGKIYILVGPGLSNGSNSYISSTQNGITSSSYASWPKSYTIIGAPTSNTGWYRGNANVSYSSGNVGIGNTAPTEKLDVTGNITLTGGLKLQSSSSNYVTLAAPSALGANITYTLPLTAPTSGQILSSSASGVMSWINPPSAPSASLITNSPSGNISGTTVQAALNELDNEKQAVDATLTALAAYNTSGFLVQTAADTFTGRNIVGVTNRTNITNGNGVAGNPTIDISTTLLPSPLVGDVGRFLKATAANTSVWTALASGDITTALGFTPINKAGDTIASGTLEFNSAGILKLSNNPVNLTDATNKQYVDNQISTASNQWTVASGNVYRNSGNVGIGTTTPATKLAISGQNTTTNFGVSNTTGLLSLLDTTTPSAVGVGPKIVFGSTYHTMGTTLATASIGSHKEFAPDNTANEFKHSLIFSTSNSGTAISEKMRITSDGSVGIGTTPSAKLDVNGTATMNASSEGISTYVNSSSSYVIPDSSVNIRRITLTGNASIFLPAFTSTPTKVYTLTVFLKQDGTGTRTANFIGNASDVVKWDSGSAPSISITANKMTIVQFTKPSDESVWYGSKVWQED